MSTWGTYHAYFRFYCNANLAIDEIVLLYFSVAIIRGTIALGDHVMAIPTNKKLYAQRWFNVESASKTATNIKSTSGQRVHGVAMSSLTYITSLI